MLEITVLENTLWTDTDGDLLTYVGLEPTVDGGSGAKTFTSATAGADTITVTTLGTSLFVDIGWQL
mgnify:CR=1 FL=1